MSQNYWVKTMQQRLGRRRVLTLAGGTAMSAAFLAACGSDSSTTTPTGGATGSTGATGATGQTGATGSTGATGRQDSGMLTRPVDTLAQAKPGGILKDRIHGDVATMDPFNPNNTLNSVIGHAFSSFVQFAPGYMKPGAFEIAPDFAESWEVSPDGMTITFKLRQGVKFHPKAPVNGREVDADDVKFSWDRYREKNTTRIAVANEASPQAPVLGIDVPDAQTAIVRLNEPVAYALGLFANIYSAGITILPKETDDTFDPRTDVIGTGPYWLSNYTPSVGFTLTRNDDYWDKTQNLPATIEKPIITEYSSVLAQLIAGNVYSFGSYFSGPQIAGEDVIPTKRQQPNIQIYEGEMAAAGLIANRLSFGWLPEGESPFLDERVRQAVVYSWDREAYMEAFYNLAAFEAEGLPVETRYRTSLLPTFEDFWLDPQGSDFGPNAKFFEYNPEESAALLSAAGHSNGLDIKSNYVVTPELSLSPKHAEVIDNFARDVGIRTTVNAIDYTQEYVGNYRDGKGQYEGWAYVSTAGAPNAGSAMLSLANEYWSKASAPNYVGHSTSGRNDMAGDPALDQMIEKGRIERDRDAQIEIVHDIQRYLAEKWYSAYLPGMGAAFVVAWPVLGNFQVFRDTTRMVRGIWIDDTKAPLA